MVVVTILAGSSVPGKNIPGIFELTPDKLIHCAEYAIFGFFLFRWVQLEFTFFSRLRMNLFTFAAGSIIGILDENYQRITPGRSPDFWDWVLDSIGVLLAILAMNYYDKRKPSTSK